MRLRRFGRVYEGGERTYDSDERNYETDGRVYEMEEGVDGAYERVCRRYVRLRRRARKATVAVASIDVPEGSGITTSVAELAVCTYCHARPGARAGRLRASNVPVSVPPLSNVNEFPCAGWKPPVSETLSTPSS
jgi:hypothetical protein